MQHTAFPRSHRREGVRTASAANQLDCGIGCRVEFPVAIGFEALGVEGDEVVIFGLKTEDLGAYVLDGVEEFAAASQKKGRIGTTELDLDTRWFRIQQGVQGSVFFRTDWIVSVGLHLAVAGKDFNL
jgi:hypothetical protein